MAIHRGPSVDHVRLAQAYEARNEPLGPVSARVKRDHATTFHRKGKMIARQKVGSDHEKRTGGEYRRSRPIRR
jgi:hypothetical protein